MFSQCIDNQPKRRTVCRYSGDQLAGAFIRRDIEESSLFQIGCSAGLERGKKRAQTTRQKRERTNKELLYASERAGFLPLNTRSVSVHGCLAAGQLDAVPYECWHN